MCNTAEAHRCRVNIYCSRSCQHSLSDISSSQQVHGGDEAPRRRKHKNQSRCVVVRNRAVNDKTLFTAVPILETCRYVNVCMLSCPAMDWRHVQGELVPLAQWPGRLLENGWMDGFNLKTMY